MWNTEVLQVYSLSPVSWEGQSRQNCWFCKQILCTPAPPWQWKTVVLGHLLYLPTSQMCRPGFPLGEKEFMCLLFGWGVHCCCFFLCCILGCVLDDVHYRYQRWMQFISEKLFVKLAWLNFLHQVKWVFLSSIQLRQSKKGQARTVTFKVIRNERNIFKEHFLTMKYFQGSGQSLWSWVCSVLLFCMKCTFIEKAKEGENIFLQVLMF